MTMKTATMTADQAVKMVTDAARQNVGRKPVREGAGMKIGQGARQGDIYIWRVADNWPRGKRIESRQLAVGNTQGSRHIADGESVEVYEGVKAPEFIKFKGPNGRTLAPLLGPLVVVTGRDFRGTHPEHDHYTLEPGCYQITHQMDMRTLSRVQD
jgi:hypothetical protein